MTGDSLLPLLPRGIMLGDLQRLAIVGAVDRIMLRDGDQQVCFICRTDIDAALVMLELKTAAKRMAKAMPEVFGNMVVIDSLREKVPAFDPQTLLPFQ